MTVSIQYNGRFADYTLSSLTQQWAAKNGDIKDTGAEEYYKDIGQFFGGGWFDGTQYSVSSSHCTDTGMIVEGDLKYSFIPQHTFYGKMEGLELGEELANNPNGIGKKLDDVQLKMCGLDITGDYDPAKTKEENHQGEMHKATYGLMRGNAEPLLEILQAKGIDINTPLKDMAIASQLENAAEIMSDSPIIDVIGTYDGAEILMAA
ncbi:heme acquisition hemophore HasA [Yersinia enterocolitica]|uniref:heme acquisition protein HasA n=6 Tax=Yersinia enterocolitica TaxID=630 RepID=UPI0005E5E5D6|nr:heme acquisition protein HasA [Yersinia enterocolitica]AOF13247.1 heme acquisition hemophore HasA [Yersinia enterocolitica]AOF17346.1 heme acquisition hemophore HasA [Yersinia enterocolitica]AOF21881.1 heme acquisition hemophore HasA [Yersinia enterocolitica]AOF25589.1 heme acquisition hemophore HasA [Yersinia enterocolitica]AOF29701.1 heme acquisition hemophore HasA [Yersinia enterocolitica]